MDQRVKGGAPNINSTLDPTPAPEDSEQDKVAEKRKRDDGENGDAGGKEEEEKKGSGKKREGNKAAVLELLIEGCCGNAGQQQLQISGRETSCPEGNVRLRIGLQAKRTKKPPKILESYVCKPTIRTYQRQGRGPLRSDGEGVGHQNKTSSTPDESNKDQCSGLNTVQPTSRQTASAVSQAFSSLASSSSPHPLLTSTLATVSTPASVPTITNQGTKSAKQVSIKLADKAEVNLNGSSDRVKKEKLPIVNGQTDSAGHKSCSSTADQTASTTPSTHCIQAPSTLEHRKEGNTSKKHNGLVQTTKQKGLSNGKGSVNILNTSTSSKSKCGIHSNSSSVSSVDSSTRPSDSTSSQKELLKRPDSPSLSCKTVNSKPQLTPCIDHSSPQSQVLDPSLQSSVEKKKEKEGNAKRDKKSKRYRLEAERAKSESRKEEGMKKKKEKGKARHGKEKDERHKTDDAWWDEIKTQSGKTEKKREKFSPDRETIEDNNAKCGETVVSGKIDKICKVLNPGRPDEIDKTLDSCKQVKKVEPATGDTYKSKEQDLTRHAAGLPSHPSSAPLSIPSPSARASVSAPCSPQEQDSRPLKKRKARRPSWTKLVQRTQRAENQEVLLDSQHNPVLGFSQNTKTSLPAKATIQQTNEPYLPSSSLTSSLSLVSSITKLPSPKQSQPPLDSNSTASRNSVTPVRKRGRPKSNNLSFDEPSPRLSPHSNPPEVPIVGFDALQKSPVQKPSSILKCATQSKSSPKKRGRPPKQPLPEDQIENALNCTDDIDRSKDFHPPEKGDRQLKIRRLIDEMKKRKKRRLHKTMLSGYIGKEGRGAEVTGGEISLRSKPIEAPTVHTLSALSSSFGSKLGPQINVSKRGTIYMGKRRGRKPKTHTASMVQTNSQNSSQSSLFNSPSEISLFSKQSQALPSHPFPSPSLSHSSGAQSPYNEGSFAEPISSLLFSHPLSLPSPSSSCTSPHPPSSSSVSPFVKKSCPCQGRHLFPFHQSSCKLSSIIPPLHHTPGSPGHLKDTTPSPRSESHSDETLPSDSGIGTDNNSVSERGDIRGVRSINRLGQGPGMFLGSQKHLLSHGERPSPNASPLSKISRHKSPISSSSVERHRERHKHRRKDYNCSNSCTCSCPCSCPGHNKCVHSDYYSCLEHSALKRQKSKHKKKHQHMQDPEFLAELEDLIGQFSDVHIGRRGWGRAGIGQGFDGSGNSSGGRRHHSSHSVCPNIFRINLNGFYSPHPSSYSANTSFSSQHFYPCQPVHCNRKTDRRQCGCPSKFQDTIENMAIYNSYPPATAFYHHLPTSYSLSTPHQYSPHQPHHAHFLLNPARFHRRRSRLLQEGALGGEVEGDLGGGSGGGLHLSSGFTSSLSCGCGRSEHKHKHKHRHRHCDRDLNDEEELQEDEDEEGIEKEELVSSKRGPGFILNQGEGGRKGTRGMGTMLSRESPWLCEKGNRTSFSAAASAVTRSSSLSTERYKQTALTSLGLGSSHLSSFGGGWGGLGQNWTKFGGLGGIGFGNTNPSWRGFNGEQQTDQLTVSNGEDEDDDDVQDSHLNKMAQSPSHTNLFTSAAMAKEGRSLRSGGGDRPWRRNEPAWTERRETVTTGLHSDWRSWDQYKSVSTQHDAEGGNKRRPGRPRKHPLPATVSSPTRSSAAPSSSSPDLLPGHSHSRDGREGGGRRDEMGVERDLGGEMVQQVSELELQASRKKGQKRKHGDSPYHRSAAADKSEYGTALECFSQSDVDEEPSQPVAFQREERADTPPRKKFLRAGLYSDDYKTTDPPSQTPQSCRETMEYMPEEHDYSLLPAPIHVGKYLRLKRIHFQLPYDVMWQWQHNQLRRPPSVPLKRKRHYCRLKERTASSHQTEKENSNDITSLFPHLYLDMKLLTSSERSFVVKHHVFLIRNWELVRDRQIQLRIERERNAEREETDSRHLSCDGSSGDDSHIKSDQPVGSQRSDPHHQSQNSSSSLTASPCPSKTQDRQEEEGEEEKHREEEACSREQRRKRLNDLLLTLQHS